MLSQRPFVRAGSRPAAPKRVQASLACRQGVSRGVVIRSRNAGLRVVGSAVAFPPSRDNEDFLDNSPSSSNSSPSPTSPSGTMGPVTMAKGGMGGSLGGSATLERSKLSFVMPTPTVQTPKLDDGGSGGDMGKNIHNGGGGGDDGGDDDDYFNEGDDDGEGGDGQGGSGRWGLLRAAIPEQYDTFSIGAVLAEWMRTVADLPAILRQAVTMGLFSSAQLVRFFAMDVRPNVTRTVTRNLPPSVARDFVGRLMADPGFVQKAVLESSIAACASLWFEYRARGEKFKDELDLALINSLGMAAATAATVWMVAPTRSYGSVQKFPWQQTLDGLPNCVFDASTPLRQYSIQSRIGGFLAKFAELSAVGAVAGGATSIMSAAAVNLRQRADPEWQPSIAVPTLGHASGGLGAYFATNANVRYQLVGGLDRLLFVHTNYLWTYLLLSGGARFASQHIGEQTRPMWQGLPAPSSLAPVQIPRPSWLPRLPRRIKKKVSKKVPKYQAVQQQQQPAALQAAVGNDSSSVVAASMAATAAAAPVPAHTPQLELAPLSGEASSSGQQEAWQQGQQLDEHAQASSSSSTFAAEAPSTSMQGITADGEALQHHQLQQRQLLQQEVHVAPAPLSPSESEDSSTHLTSHQSVQGPQYAQQ